MIYDSKDKKPSMIENFSVTLWFHTFFCFWIGAMGGKFVSLSKIHVETLTLTQ